MKDQESLDLTKTPCAKCGKIPKEEEMMVACDNCDEWFDYTCADVNNSVKQFDWFCEAAACQEASKASTNLWPSLSAEDEALMDAEKRRMEEEAKREEKLEARRRALQVVMKKEQQLKKQQLDEEFRKLELEERKRLNAELLKAQQEHNAKLLEEDSSFQKQMAALLEESKNALGVPGSSGKLKLCRKVGATNHSTPIAPSSEKDPENEEEDSSTDEESEYDESNGEKENDDPPKKQAGDKVDDVTGNKSKDATGDQPKETPTQRSGPTRAQLAARHSIGKNLPNFSGEVKEWPLFYAAYKSSTEACGFSDVENLARLNNHLREGAKELVYGQLAMPHLVPRIIEKLRKTYGRPAKLLEMLMERVQKLSPPKELKDFIPFANAVEQLCDHLEGADLKDHLRNPLLIKDLVKKLPDLEKRQWVDVKRAQKDQETTLRTLSDFLIKIADDAQEAEVDIDSKPEPKSSSSHASKKKKEKGSVFTHVAGNSPPAATNERKGLKPCKICQRTDHRLRFCQDFKNLPLADRIAMVNSDKLCKLCLGEHGGQCRYKFRCNVGNCNEAHNPLIHSTAVVGINAHISSSSSLLFRMLPIQLHWGEKMLEVIAFLDEGSDVTLIEGSLANQLGIVGAKEKLTIRWTANYTRVEKDSRKLNVWASAVGGEKMLLKTARTVGKLMMPRQKLDVVELVRQYQHMRGLPISSYDGQPGILIGANNIHAFAPLEAKIGTVTEPIAVRCPLGWAVYGPRQEGSEAEGFVCHHHEVSNEQLHDLLKNHYALEECGVTAAVAESAEDGRAREILERTTQRDGDRFQTGLLWKEDNPKFPPSYQMALRRNEQLERKMKRNPELFDILRRQVEEYQLKGYAHLATKEELDNTEPDRVWYLPINVVLNPKKPGKVRIVWDAAALVQGVSLNSKLLKGPDLLVPLVSVIMGFRERRIAFGGDLKEMFHQLRIIKEDRQAQRFLFRPNTEEEPKVYVMDVATFGSTCSPSSAQFVKNRNAEEHATRYPEAAAAIINNHYVDDYFDSVDTVEEAVKRAQQVKLVHKNGGFEIRNWVSNSPEVLQCLGEEKPVAPVHFNRDKESEKERVLGIVWDPLLDEFSFSTQQREEVEQYLHGGKRPTKRIAMSCVMGFFDPLGLLSPFTIHGKIVLQHLWRKGCDWDALIDDEGWELWQRWVGLLPEVEAVRVPRCFIGNAASSEVESLELHIFTDASEHAYGCVAYLRAVIDGEVHCSLVMSRAKVAPLKRQSIPRLELMAALLGARMSHTIKSMLSLPIARVVFWTDSRTVCAWLQSDQYRFKQFVAFRVGEILELTRLMDWRWISTKLNIADVLTKWGHGPPLQSDGVWFRGPSFLRLPEDQWPSVEAPSEGTNEDVRGIVLFHQVVEVEAFGTWNKSLRVTAMVLRFIGNCKRKRQGSAILTTKATKKQLRVLKTTLNAVETTLQQNELDEAEQTLWKQAQWDSFPDEMSVLKKNLESSPGQKADRITKRSSIYKLSPILDANGVLRVDGRLANAEELPFDQRFPVILCRSHPVTKKIIQDHHERFGHANGETVFNEMRKKFEIPNLRAAIARISNECVWCKVHRCVPYTPRMAPLPIQRVTREKRPFSSVGVDYLGPVEVSVGRRREKRWVAVFTCLAVRAVHLEVVHSLSTQSCLMAIRRFACRFGEPVAIFSDNATCFRGAWNETVRTKARINQECAEKVVSPSTAWYFNPPGTPHMGGVWERMVRSVKAAMKALDDGRKMNDEILTTTIAQAADMINSRPLTYKPQEPAGEEALTPNHFLRGTVTTADVETDSVDAAEALRNVYKRAEYLSNRMWARWIDEYLLTINKRSKWIDEQRQLKVDDLVFLVDGANRKNWRRGKVVEVFPGKDGIIRQVDVMTMDKKVHRRGAVNVAVLEIEDSKSGSY